MNMQKLTLETQQLFFTFELYDKLKALLITYLTELQGTNMSLLNGYLAASSALPPIEYVCSGPVQQF